MQTRSNKSVRRFNSCAPSTLTNCWSAAGDSGSRFRLRSQATSADSLVAKGGVRLEPAIRRPWLLTSTLSAVIF